jgi:inorganic pyrophosphatase
MNKLARIRVRVPLMATMVKANRLSSISTFGSTAGITSKEIGSKYTPNYRSYAMKDGKVISYFHDIPLGLDLAAKEANMIVEIPRWSNGKFEIDTSLQGNPIVQDIKKGKVRFVKNLFPYKGYIHNYGAFPQTWEDPSYKDADVDYYGDNDPVDVCEIGTTVFKLGDVIRVKILGSIALIDDGELDWKIIAISVNDPLAKELNDIDDVYAKCPGLLESTRKWFRDYKLPDGKPKNKFAFNGNYKNQLQTLDVIQKCSNHWQNLMLGTVTHGKLPNTANTTMKSSKGYFESFNEKDLLSYEKAPDAPIPDDVDLNFYPTKL